MVINDFWPAFVFKSVVNVEYNPFSGHAVVGKVIAGKKMIPCYSDRRRKKAKLRLYGKMHLYFIDIVLQHAGKQQTCL